MPPSASASSPGRSPTAPVKAPLRQAGVAGPEAHRRTASAKRRDGYGALPGTPLQLRHERFHDAGLAGAPFAEHEQGHAWNLCVARQTLERGPPGRGARLGAVDGATRIHASQFADLCQIGRDRELDRIDARTPPRPARAVSGLYCDDQSRVPGGNAPLA